LDFFVFEIFLKSLDFRETQARLANQKTCQLLKRRIYQIRNPRTSTPQPKNSRYITMSHQPLT